MSDLTNRAVVVTGGTGALGSAVVSELVARGADCFVPMLEGQAPERLAALGDRVHAVAGVDLSSDDAVREFYAQLPSLAGSVHIAGGFAMKPALDISASDLRAMLELNLMTSFLCSREAARRMPNGGSIVNVGARPAVDPVGGMSAYVASKAAVVALTQALAAEWLGQNIRVNVILPSIIDTPRNRQDMPDSDHESWPKPAQLARTIGFLLSDASATTSGAAIPVYGRA